MRIVIFLFLPFAFFSSCTSDQQKARKEIRALEKQIEEDASPFVTNALIRQYTLYNINYPSDRETNSRFLYRAASMQLIKGDPEVAVNTLLGALNQYGDTKNTLNNALLLAAIYTERLQDTITPATIYQTLHKKYPADASISEKLQAFNPESPPLETRLEAMRQGVFSDASGNINYLMAGYFILSCELHGFLLPDDQASPEWLNKAAEIARATKKHSHALQLYQRVFDRYPSYEKAPQALFLKGFILDEEMGQKEEARKAYEQFLEKYPGNEFADDAQFLLDNLDKNEAEIIEQFQEQVQDQES